MSDLSAANTSVEPPSGAALRASGGKKLRSSRDPNVPHPDRIFYGGRWMTPEQVERDRARGRKYREKNRDKYDAIRREHYEKNRESILKRRREYQSQPHVRAERALRALYYVKIY